MQAVAAAKGDITTSNAGVFRCVCFVVVLKKTIQRSVLEMMVEVMMKMMKIMKITKIKGRRRSSWRWRWRYDDPLWDASFGRPLGNVAHRATFSWVDGHVPLSH